MIYAIMPFNLASEKKLRANIEKHTKAQYLDEAPKAYFVSYDGTTRELADLIGYNEKSDVGTGIVIPITNHAGYANKDLWEWIRLYG